MKNYQKGSTGIIVMLVVLVLAGIILGYYWNNKPAVEVPNTNAGANNTNVSQGGSTNNSGGTSVLTPNSNTSPTGSAVITTSSEVFPGGITYRLPYGLTLPFPASWAPYAISKQSPSYGGVTPTDSTTITLPDGPVLTLNTFTKEQWNRIKTQENAANQNTASLGEGEYLGENSTYIYSYIILGREAEARQVLQNIISF